jgi:signal transduction histidine kinase
VALERDRRGGSNGEQRSEFPADQLNILVRALALERAALFLEEAPGRTFRRVAVHGRVRPQSLAPDESPCDGPWSAVLPVQAGGRHVGFVLVARPGGFPLTDADGAVAEWYAKVTGLVVEHGRMAGDLDRSRELLARADRLSALGTLAAGVAHEIRNPLVSVRTFIQLLPEREHDQEFRTTFRELALSEIERICTLINDLLAFSRPAPAQLESTDLNDVAGQIARLLDAEARKRGVTLICRPDPALPLVVVDSAQVKQVLMNVVLNAIQACEARGTVEVTTHVERGAEARWCVVAVADSGLGIPPEQVAQVFDPFFTTKNAGSGLGLYIAHRIMKDHGGDIRVAPRDGGGTIFVIQFPQPLEREDARAR